MENFRIKYNRLVQILGFVMVFVCSMLGMVLLFIPGFYENLKGLSQFIIGILLIHVAVYIAYHTIKTNPKRQ